MGSNTQAWAPYHTPPLTLECTRTSTRTQTGWTGLKSFYATVASTVEQAAKQQGYNLDLGAKAAAQSVAASSSSRGGYGGYGSGSGGMGGSGNGRGYGGGGYGGYEAMGEQEDEHGWGNGRNSAAYGNVGQGVAQPQQQGRGTGGGANGFSGFDEGDEHAGGGRVVSLGGCLLAAGGVGERDSYMTLLTQPHAEWPPCAALSCAIFTCLCETPTSYTCSRMHLQAGARAGTTGPAEGQVGPRPAGRAAWGPRRAQPRQGQPRPQGGVLRQMTTSGGSGELPLPRVNE